MPALLWDLCCRVVDNLGDAGFCWRVAADLARRGQRVRLIIDDATPLAFMAPGGAEGVEVRPWPGPEWADDLSGDVVVEAFGCGLPTPLGEALAQRWARGSGQPVWIDLEYLSAEPYVERSHGLPSPQPDGRFKWFYYPGFTARTGGLLREPTLPAARAAFKREAWLAAQGLHVRPGERVVSLFCYDNAALPALLADLARAPTLLLLTPGAAQRQVTEQVTEQVMEQVTEAPPGLRLHRLPWLSQTDYDRLLWASDLNFVRGEDSLVRAIWAGAPFVWQAYPQHDGAHHAKLEAMLEAMRAPASMAALWRAWNGCGDGPWPGLPALGDWQAACAEWRARLWQQPDLTTQLVAFAAGRAAGPGGVRRC